MYPLGHSQANVAIGSIGRSKNVLDTNHIAGEVVSYL
jgi:hypothetical protein